MASGRTDLMSTAESRTAPAAAGPRYATPRTGGRRAWFVMVLVLIVLSGTALLTVVMVARGAWSFSFNTAKTGAQTEAGSDAPATAVDLKASEKALADIEGGTKGLRTEFEKLKSQLQQSEAARVKAER